jgi:hypothetical protein
MLVILADTSCKPSTNKTTNTCTAPNAVRRKYARIWRVAFVYSCVFVDGYPTPAERTEGAFKRLVEDLNSLKG